MNIVIPSSKRENKQTTLASLPPSLYPRTTIVVPTGELPAYWSHSAYVKVVECPHKGIGNTRQWILENFGPKVVMLDDDLVFATRREDEPSKFRDSTPAEIEKLIADIEYALTMYAHVGVSTREGGNRVFDDYLRVGRMLRILAYRADVLAREGITFNQLPVMEDFDVTLSLLTKGYQNVIWNWMVHDQNGSNLAGGCSQYRTSQVQTEAAYQLHAKYPDFVSVVTRATKIAWGGGDRTDVRIQWKRAYESAGITRLLDP